MKCYTIWVGHIANIAYRAKDKDKKLFTDNMKLAAEQFQAAARVKSNALDALFQLGMCYRDMALIPRQRIPS